MWPLWETEKKIILPFDFLFLYALSFLLFNCTESSKEQFAYTNIAEELVKLFKKQIEHDKKEMIFEVLAPLAENGETLNTSFISEWFIDICLNFPSCLWSWLVRHLIMEAETASIYLAAYECAHTQISTERRMDVTFGMQWEWFLV